MRPSCFKTWFGVILIAVFAVMISLFPLWYGEQDLRVGEFLTSLGRDDEYVYLTWVRQAKEGEWLFDNPYTLEPHRRLYFNPLFLVMGKIAAWFNLSPFTAFNIFRVMAGSSLVIGVFLFLGELINHDRWRLITLLVICFGGGLGYLSFSRPAVIRNGDDLFWASRAITEARFLPSILFYPQGPISVLLLMALWTGFLKLRKNASWVWLGSSLIAGNLLIAIHPYDLLLAGLIPLGLMIMELPVTRRDLLALGILFLSLFPMALYFFAVSQLDPVYAAWTQTKQSSPPSKLQWIVLYAPLLPLALAGLGSFIKGKMPGWVKRESRILVIWLVILPLLLYLPVNFQRRLAEGAYLPIGFLATMGVFYLWQRFSRLGLILGVFLIGISLPDYPFQACIRARVLKEDVYEGYYLLQNDLSSFSWLNHYLPRHPSIVALPDYGLFLPAFTNGRVYLGHWANTINSSAKRDRLREVFQPGSPSSFRTQLIKENQIVFVLASKNPPFPFGDLAIPWEDKGLSNVFENETMVIFQALESPDPSKT